MDGARQVGAVTFEMLRRWSSAGLNPMVVVRDEGIPLSTLRAAERRHGLWLPRCAPGENVLRVDHREAVQDMKPLDAVEYLLDVIESVMPPPDAELAWAWPGIHLTPQEKRVLRVLAAGKRGVPVPKVTIHAEMSGDHCDRKPETGEKIVDVRICILRRKLRGTGVEIGTVWGQGYVVAVPAGFVWPWAGAEGRA